MSADPRGSAARCPDCGQTAEHHVAALCRLQAPGQERRAEALTTSAPVRTIQHDPGRVSPFPMSEAIAKAFHDTYERLAPSFGYRTREASAKPWDDVPDANKRLMIAVVYNLLADDVIEPGPEVLS